MAIRSKEKTEIEAERDSMSRRADHLAVQLKTSLEKASAHESGREQIELAFEDFKINTQTDNQAKRVLIQSLTDRVAVCILWVLD